MLAFCGQDSCKLDKNGRIKFSPRIIADFETACQGEVVLYCLPEGAIAVYPEDVYMQMRRKEARPAEKAADSILFRRSMRRFGALSKSEKITGQGRVTIPPAYKNNAGLTDGCEVVIVGVEIGVEIWSLERWNKEMNAMNDFIAKKHEQEIATDLNMDG